MASIFLSYAHQDQDRATRIAVALEQAGHQVWWDRNIRAGRRFSVEIDEALTSADWIVVLWSKTSIVSPWVQDEAAVGRDSGRLIPTLLDEVMPPLGFRQYQAISLGKVNARGGHGSSDAVRSLLTLLADPSNRSGTAPFESAATSRQLRPLPWRLLAIAAAALLVLVGALAWWRVASGKDNAVAITAAASSDPALSQNLARQAVIDLGRFPGTLLENLSFTADADAAQTAAALRIAIAAQRDEKLAHVDISLQTSRRSGIVWATTIDGRLDRLADLRQHIAAYLSAALGCATHYGEPADRLSDDVFRSFLTGCVGLANGDGPLANMATFKSITAKAPAFGPGWANLALLEVLNISDVPDAERPAFIANMRAHLAKAKQLAPDLEETLAADALVRRPDETTWAHSLPKLDKAILRVPDSALLLTLRAQGLQNVGRMTEAVDGARRALNAEPLTPGARSDYISSLAFSGHPQAAEAELSKAEAIWPESFYIRLIRFIFELRFGDPRIALKMLETDQTGMTVAVAEKKSWQMFLEARINPSSTNIDRALASFRERYRHDPADIPGFAQALGTFGRLDEFFAVARNPVTLDSMTGSTEVLFRLPMKPILHDPRFIELAHRLGLLAFWRASRVWPDYCHDPDLPYDCQREAAKYH